MIQLVKGQYGEIDISDTWISLLVSMIAPWASSRVIRQPCDVTFTFLDQQNSHNTTLWLRMIVNTTRADTADQGSIWWDTHLRHMDITAGVHDGSLDIVKNNQAALWWVLHLGPSPSLTNMTRTVTTQLWVFFSVVCCGGKTQIRFKDQYHIWVSPTRLVLLNTYGFSRAQWGQIGITCAKHPFGWPCL